MLSAKTSFSQRKQTLCEGKDQSPQKTLSSQRFGKWQVSCYNLLPSSLSYLTDIGKILHKGETTEDELRTATLKWPEITYMGTGMQMIVEFSI